jgi:hypothetical protein
VSTLDAQRTPSSAQPAETPKPEAPRASLLEKTSSFVARSLLSIAGLGLLIGFFLPWVKLGELVEASGFTLVVSSGQVIEQLSGPHRLLLFVVPVSALLLLFTAIRGTRGTTVVAVMSGLFILGYGFYTLVRLFFESTGLGMWLVVGSALLALSVGLVSYGNHLRHK